MYENNELRIYIKDDFSPCRDAQIKDIENVKRKHIGRLYERGWKIKYIDAHLYNHKILNIHK